MSDPSEIYDFVAHQSEEHALFVLNAFRNPATLPTVHRDEVIELKDDIQATRLALLHDRAAVGELKEDISRLASLSDHAELRKLKLNIRDQVKSARRKLISHVNRLTKLLDKVVSKHRRTYGGIVHLDVAVIGHMIFEQGQLFVPMMNGSLENKEYEELRRWLVEMEQHTDLAASQLDSFDESEAALQKKLNGVVNLIKATAPESRYVQTLVHDVYRGTAALIEKICKDRLHLTLARIMVEHEHREEEMFKKRAALLLGKEGRGDLPVQQPRAQRRSKRRVRPATRLREAR